MLLVAWLFMASLGCDSSSSAPPAPEPAPAPEPSDTVPQMPRANAVQIAETFVREQGYTERLPPAGVAVQREWLDAESDEAILAERRGRLHPRSVGAFADDGAWAVVFSYSRGRRRTEVGRAARVHADGSVEMAHMDALLREPLTELTLRARLAALPVGAPHCGTQHVAVVARYDVVEVVRGSYEGDHAMVMHGCPELPRASYDNDTGNAPALTQGALYEITLTPHTPDVPGGLLIVDSADQPDLHRYWATRTDAT